MKYIYTLFAARDFAWVCVIGCFPYFGRICAYNEGVICTKRVVHSRSSCPRAELSCRLFAT